METASPLSNHNESCPICSGTPQSFRLVTRAGRVAICGACRSWYRIPRPTLGTLKEIYQKDYYDSWGLNDQPTSVQATKRASFLPILKHLEKKMLAESPFFTLLDVGAATGNLMELGKERGWQVSGIELNPYSAEILRSRFGSETIWEGELLNAPFPAKSFHAVTLCDVLEHVLEVKETLEKVHQLLKKGGTICITTPDIDSWSRQILGENWLHFKEEHIQYFSTPALTHLLKEVGFKNITVSPYWKHLTFDYVQTQLTTYKHSILTPLFSFIHSLTPKHLRNCPAPFLFGEKLIFAEA